MENKNKNNITKKTNTGNKHNRTTQWLKKHDHQPEGAYTANINTKILHTHDCRHTHKILPENQLNTNNNQAQYRPCSHCTPDKNSIQTLLQLKNLQDNAQPCTDPQILQTFQTGCPEHGTKNGTIKMYPDNTYGQKIQGKPGKWHTYYYCNTCKQKTPYHIAQHQTKIKTNTHITNPTEGITT